MFQSRHALRSVPVVTPDLDPTSALVLAPKVTIGGLPIAVVDRATSAHLMFEAALTRRATGYPPLIVTSANGQVVSMCAHDHDVRRLFLNFDIIHADGMPLVFASRLLGTTPLPERVATTDLFHDVAELAERCGGRFYFLGATPSVLEEAVRRVRCRYPKLTIVGYRDGYFSCEEETRVVDAINAAGPDVLWIGMGVPAEQSFALRNRDHLRGVGIIKTSGGLFDFLSGKNSRAPGWMQIAGLEWLYRILLEPRRLFVRYLTTNFHALVLLLTHTGRTASRTQTKPNHR